MGAYMACGLDCEIRPSDKKDSALVKGRQYIAVIRGTTKSADELGVEVVTQLLAKALAFALAECEKDKEPGRYRLDMNGPQVGTRSHLHIHIKLPRGDDKLAPLVAR